MACPVWPRVCWWLRRREFGPGWPIFKFKHKEGTIMLHRIAISLFAVALAAPLSFSFGASAQTPMRARPPEQFKYLPSKEVEALTSKPGPGAQTSFPVDHEDYDVEYAQRSDKGNEPEVHTYRT